MGDADQRRDDEIIQVDRGVAFLVGLPGRSGEKARRPIGQKASPARRFIGRCSWCWSLRPWPQCRCWRDRNHCSLLEIPLQLRESRLLRKLDLTYVRPTERTKVEQLRFRRIRSVSHCRRRSSPQESTSGAMLRRSGDKGLRVSARDSGPTSRSRLLEPRRVMGWRKPSRKIRCTTAANAEAHFRGCAMP